MTHRSLRRRIALGLPAGVLATTVVAAPAQAASFAAAPAAPARVSTSLPADTSTPSGPSTPSSDTSTSPTTATTPGELKSTSDPADPERDVSQDTGAASTMWWLITGIGALALISMFFMMRRRRGARQ